MNRHLLRALPGALLFLAALATQAHAGKWVTKEIKWHLASVGSPTSGTAIYVRDTTFNAVGGASVPDTTAPFTLNEADEWRVHPTAATNADTTIVAYLVLVQDSLGVTANTISSITTEIDGRIGGYGNTMLGSWTQVDSTVTKIVNTPANNSMAIPIRAVSAVGAGQDGENNVNNTYKLFAYDALRVRITAATGVISACRAFVRYFDRDS